MKGNSEVKIKVRELKLRWIRFEGDEKQDDQPKYRVVSIDPLKSHGDRIVEVVEYKDVQNLIEAVTNFYKQCLVGDDMLDFRLSQWKELANKRMV